MTRFTPRPNGKRVTNTTPAPTNKVQQHIWNRVHSIPDRPMKIKFDPASQKGKVTK